MVEGTNGEAGAAARRMAEDAQRAADRLEQKAANARKIAENYAAGAAGEEAVERALAPLSAAGWFAIHDRVMPTGGNIDHIVVGPGAVIVIDAKAWNGQLEVRDGKLFNGGWSQTKALRKLEAQRDAVRSCVGSDGPVDMALVITTQPDFGPEVVDEAIVLGIGHLRGAIESSRTSYTATQVEQMLAKLVESFPVAGTAPPAATGLQQVDGVEVGDFFDRANRFLYLNQWRRHGRHRIYMRDQDGEQFGWKDVATGDLHLDHDDDAMAEAVLRAATPRGVELTGAQIPKVQLPVRGGKLLGWFGKVYVSVMVGSLWKGQGKNRLYGTLANPTEGVFELGYVDLATGWIKPSSKGPLSRDRGPAERYLALLRDRSPFDTQ